MPEPSGEPDPDLPIQIAAFRMQDQRLIALLQYGEVSEVMDAAFARQLAAGLLTLVAWAETQDDGETRH